jgi:heptosyltransferase-2
MPWADQLITYRTGRTKARAGRGLLDLAGRLRSARFDLAVLLPNSFKSALVCKLAKIEQVVGYDRDGRSFLLTDKLLPVKQAGKFIPTPLVRYYMGLARYLGSSARDLSLQLFITDPERRAAAQVLNRAGIDPSIHRPGAAGRGPLVLFNPGAAHGEAKCWLPEYFAELADRMMEELGATILLAGAPRERPIIQAVRRKIKGSVADLIDADLDLGSLKEITRRCDLVVTNDTGARHVAAAMQTPVVTIFGPTDPQWTEINFAHERKVSVKVFCGPCQKKYCPLDHRCMTRVTPAMVFNASRDLLRQQSGVTAT